MKPFKLLTTLLSLVALTLSISGSVFAQDKTAQQTPPPTKKGVVFKIPDGFLPADIPPNKKGLMMLDPKKPAGIFVANTPDNQKSEVFITELRKTFAGMFVHDDAAQFEWKESALPAHDGTNNETGKLMTTSFKDTEVQVAVYTRTIAENQDVVYGYFAMKNSKSKKDGAKFVDATGNGVKEFEKFWKTVEVGK